MSMKANRPLERQGRDYRHYPDWIHQELLNWSRWCWQGPYPHPLRPSHCYSVEHQYVGHHLEEEEESEPIPARPLAPIAARAMMVDAAWQRMVGAPRLVLRAEYPQRWSSGRIEHGQIGAARRLHMRLAEYEAALSVAIGRVWDALRDPV